MKSLSLLLCPALLLGLLTAPPTASAQNGPQVVATACEPTAVDVSRLPDGRALVTWVDGGVQARIVGIDGQPQGEILEVAPVSTATLVRGFSVGPDRLVFVWRDEPGGRIRARSVDLLGPSFGEIFEIASSSMHMDADGWPGGRFAVVWDASGAQEGLLHEGLLWDLDAGPIESLDIQKPRDPEPGGLGMFRPEVAVRPSGETWVSHTFFEDVLLASREPSGVTLQGFDADGRRLTDRTEGWTSFPSGLPAEHDLAPRADGEVAIAFRHDPSPNSTVSPVFYARVAPPDPSGALFLTLSEIRVDDDLGLGLHSLPRVAAGPAAQDFVVWLALQSSEISRLVGRYVTPSGGIGPELPLSNPQESVVQADATFLGGRPFVVWGSVTETSSTPSPTCPNDGRIARLHVPPAMGPGLLLQDDRFQVTVTWEDPRTGDSGVGTGVPVTDDTGTFWFFDEQNLELMVKVLDARPVNGHFWVFFGSLTDVEFELTVTDLVTGNDRTYSNPPFEMASRADTMAFDDP